MSIPVEFKNATRDTIIRFWNTLSGQSFTAGIPFTADSVLFDPDYQLISGNNTINGITEHPWQYKLKIFPNPANTLLNVNVGQPGLKLDYRIFSSDGKLIKTGTITGQEDQINIMELPDDLFSIVFLYGDQSSTLTFIKKR